MVFALPPIGTVFKQRFSPNDQLRALSSLAKLAKDPLAPPLRIRWFYATDIPESMPPYFKYTKVGEPKKFSAFSEADSNRLEKEYQRLLNKEPFRNIISVNEDLLFEVDLESRTMYPVYWEGAVYQVRRGGWFTTEAQPVPEELTDKLERGYCVMRPYESEDDIEKVNPLSKKNVADDVYELPGGRKVLYADSSYAYVLDEGYGGMMQLNFLKAVKSLPAIGAQLLKRGFGTPEAEKEKAGDEQPDEFGLASFDVIADLFNTGKAVNEVDTSKALELEMKDYKSDDEDGAMSDTDDEQPQERQIDHLIFCVHGIGQMLGTKYQNVNFVHTVNIMRKNLKKVYSQSNEMQECVGDPTNCRVQVLPISWRQKLSFNNDDDVSETLPSLNDITVSELRPMRNMMGSVLFDILLYYEPQYLSQIYHQVIYESNRQYDIFKKRHPDFKGKVSIIGHSLGSCIALDILTKQPDILDPLDPNQLHFKVENYFAIGSPAGLFNLLKGYNIGPRSTLGQSTDKVLTLACNNYYNIFHPCDPVGYRVEPLVMKEMKKYEAESIPFMIEDFNKQLSTLAQFSDNFRTKVMATAADSWSSQWSNYMGQRKDQQQQVDVTKEAVKKATGEVVEMTPEQLKVFTALNYNGRVDFALQQGYLDFSIVSGLTAHVSYFEDENVAAFILKEAMAPHELVKEKKMKTLILDETD